MLIEGRSNKPPQYAPFPEAVGSPDILGTDIRETFWYPSIGYRVEIVGPNDSRMEKAFEIEVATMVRLGDPEHEVRIEFPPYKHNSMYFLGFKEGGKGAPEDLCAMGRIILFDEKTGNKTLTDLASIEAWSATDNKETRDVQQVTEEFLKESDCSDTQKVWDIATFAPNPELVENGMDPLKAAKAISNAFAQVTMRAWEKGEVTHATSFIEEYAHRIFTKFGFPFHDMFGLGPMLYNSFGSDEGMMAQPAWLSIEDLAYAIQNPSTPYFHQLALYMPMDPEKAVVKEEEEDVAPKDRIRGRFTYAAMYGWSHINYVGMVAGGEALQHGAGVSAWLAGLAVAGATTGETYGMSHVASKGIGDYVLSDKNIFARAAKKIGGKALVPHAGSLWSGAPSGVMTDMLAGKTVTPRKRLAYSIPYAVAVGGWVTPIPKTVAGFGLDKAQDTFKHAKDHPIEGGIGGAAILGTLAAICAAKKLKLFKRSKIN